MKAEVCSIKSIKLVPENDSDRAILQAFSDMMTDKSLSFQILSDGSRDGHMEFTYIGFSAKLEGRSP